MNPVIEKTAKEETIDLTPEAPRAAESKPTLKEAQESNLSPQEIEMAKKSGMLEEGTPAKEPVAAEPEPAAAKPDDKAKPKFEPKPWEKDIPEDESAQLEQFTPNEKALYWKQKREKYRRQQVEAERDQLRATSAYYKGQAETAQKMATEAAKKPVVPADPLDPLAELGDEPIVDDKNKPLTQGDLDRIEKEKADKLAAQEKQFEDRKKQVLSKLDEQENEFKQDHEDWDEKAEFSKQILDVSRSDAKLAELFPDKLQRRAVKSMAEEMLWKLVNPDQVKAGDATAAELAYEIGKLHPKAHPSDGADLDDLNDGKTRNGGSDPIEKRLERSSRPSSASLSGGGSAGNKTIKDLTLKDIVDMPGPKFAALKKKYPADIERILRENNVD